MTNFKIEAFSTLPELKYRHIDILFNREVLEIGSMGFIDLSPIGYNHFITALLDMSYDIPKVVGTLNFSKAPEGKNWITTTDLKFIREYEWCMTGIRIDEKYQGNRLSRPLIKGAFELLSESGIKHILQSGYSFEGFQKVRPIFKEYSQKYPVLLFLDNEVLV